MTNRVSNEVVNALEKVVDRYLCVKLSSRGSIEERLQAYQRATEG